MADSEEVKATGGMDEVRGVSHPLNGDPSAVRSQYVKCPMCGSIGEHRILALDVPFFREIIIMAFECEECGHRDNEVQSSEVGDLGVHYELTCANADDLNRQIVKSEYATITFPEIGFQIPPSGMTTVLTTVEGLLTNAVNGLQQTAEQLEDEETANKLREFVEQLAMYCAGARFPFRVVLDDISGNSFIENPHAPSTDPNLLLLRFRRSLEQNHALGLYVENIERDEAEGGADDGHKHDDGCGCDSDHDHEHDDIVWFIPAERFQGAKPGYFFTRRENGLGYYLDTGAGGSGGTSTAHGAELEDTRAPADGPTMGPGVADGMHVVGSSLTADERAAFEAQHPESGKHEDGDMHVHNLNVDEDANEQVMKFHTTCYSCGGTAEERMLLVDVPFFKEVIIMSAVCDTCGYRNAQVRTGGATPEKGVAFELHVAMDTATKDLRRDVIKSDTCAIEIPELELSLVRGTLGGVYTSVEGLLTSIRDNLMDVNPNLANPGDSAKAASVARFAEIMESLSQMASGERPFTLKLHDPLGGSFIQSPYAPQPDPRLVVTYFDRTEEENDEFGLNDMVTEGFE